MCPSNERFELFIFTVLNRTVEVDGDAATGRLYLAEVRQDGAGRATTAYGVYEDHYARDEQGWLIAERLYRSLARTAQPSTPADFDVVTRPGRRTLRDEAGPGGR